MAILKKGLLSVISDVLYSLFLCPWTSAGTFMWFTWVFCRVLYRLLRSTIKHFGISGTLLALLEAYLFDRQHLMRYGRHDIHQGSNFGPL